MDDEKLFITCPKCHKVTQLLHVTTGVSILSKVSRTVEDQQRRRRVCLSGHTQTNGKFAGYQCEECRAILATDSDTCIGLIDKHITTLSPTRSNALASMNALYEELSLIIDPDSKMSHDQKVEHLKTIVFYDVQ